MESAVDRALELVALRQQQRRNFNERLAALDPPEAAGAAARYRCECGLIACGTTIELTPGEYDDVRSDPRHFVVLATHVLEEAELVVARRRGWAIIEQPARASTPSRDAGSPVRR